MLADETKPQETASAGSQEPANIKPAETPKPEETSPYRAEIERLKHKYEKELAHKERTIQSKDEVNQRLLDEVRTLREELTSPPKGDDDIVEADGTKFKKKEIASLEKAMKVLGYSPEEWKSVRDTIGEIKSHLVSTREETAIERLTSDAEERELIRLHLEHTVKRTGNIEEDVRNAFAIANKHLAEKKLSDETEVASGVASAAGAEIGGGRLTIAPGMSSGKREALKLLKAYDPKKKWEKYLK